MTEGGAKKKKVNDKESHLCSGRGRGMQSPCRERLSTEQHAAEEACFGLLLDALPDSYPVSCMRLECSSW